MLNINNMPATVRAWIVAREVNGELWFWGSWDDRRAAEKAAREIGGMAIDRELVEV
jgi:hypothetical protein